MWNVYKKRFIPTQIFIVVCLALFWFVADNRDWPKFVGVIVVLELFSIWGAWWGFRLERRLGDRDQPR